MRGSARRLQARQELHGIVDKQQVLRTLRRMAEIVDRQNAGDPAIDRWRPDLTALPSTPPATCQGTGAAERLYRMDFAPAPARGGGRRTADTYTLIATGDERD